MSDAVFRCRLAEIPAPPRGLRFDLAGPGGGRPGFLVRGRREPRAYLNRCAHQAFELDFNPGLFFDTADRYLMCATHGALFDVDSGLCLHGPCAGARLEPLDIVVVGDEVIVREPPPPRRPADI